MAYKAWHCLEARQIVVLLGLKCISKSLSVKKENCKKLLFITFWPLSR